MEIDILNIDKTIREKWNVNESRINDINQKIHEMEEILQSKNLSVHVVNDLKENIQVLQKQKETEFHNDLYFYIMEVTPLLETYTKLISQPMKISFMSKKDQNHQELRSIVKQYLDIIKRYNIDYANLEYIVSTNNKTSLKKKECPVCRSQQIVYNELNNVEICESCGLQEEKICKTTCYKDNTRVNISNKYTYERRVHFKDCINQYQGKQNATIHPNVYRDIEKQLELHGLLKEGETKQERFAKVTKDHILVFLKETGHSKHYEDIVLIYHKLTGKKVDDISSIEDKLMEDFDQISNVYDQKFKFTGKIDRKSFINTQYVLFQLLRRHKYPGKRTDFNMLKTLDRKSFHDDVVKEIFEALDFNFTPIF